METNTATKNPIDIFLEETAASRAKASARMEAIDSKLDGGGFFGPLFREHNRFGMISMALLVVGCLGGAAVGLGALASIPQLILLVFATMSTLTLIISVAPVKQIALVGIAAVIIDIAVILANIL